MTAFLTMNSTREWGAWPVEELNALEMDFLFAIHFSLIRASGRLPGASQRALFALQLHLRELPLSLRVVVTRRWAPHSASGYRAEDADLLVSLLLLHDVFGQSVITSRPCPTVHLASRLLQQTTIRLGASLHFLPPITWMWRCITVCSIP